MSNRNKNLLNVKRNRDVNTILEDILEEQTRKVRKNKLHSEKDSELRNSSKDLENGNQDDKKKPGHKKVIMDESGQLKDQFGNTIQVQSQVKATLQINKNKEKEKKVRELMKAKKTSIKETIESKHSRFYDPTLENIKSNRDKRKSNAYQFLHKGFFQRNTEMSQKIKAAQTLGIDLNQADLNEQEEQKLLNPELIAESYNMRSHIVLKARVNIFI